MDKLYFQRFLKSLLSRLRSKLTAYDTSNFRWFLTLCQVFNAFPSELDYQMKVTRSIYIPTFRSNIINSDRTSSNPRSLTLTLHTPTKLYIHSLSWEASRQSIFLPRYLSTSQIQKYKQ